MCIVLRDCSLAGSVHGTKTASAMGFFNDSREQTARPLECD